MKNDIEINVGDIYVDKLWDGAVILIIEVDIDNNELTVAGIHTNTQQIYFMNNFIDDIRKGVLRKLA